MPSSGRYVMVSLKQRLNNLNGWQRLWVVFSFLALLASLVAAASLAKFETTYEKTVEQLLNDPAFHILPHDEQERRLVNTALKDETFKKRPKAVREALFDQLDAGTLPPPHLRSLTDYRLRILYR